MNKIKIILLTLLVSASALAQEDNEDYTIENIWGITKNTASGLIAGVILKKSIRKTSNSFTTYGIELISYKHPAQLKIKTENSRFTVGKINYLFAIRGQYGRNYILFKKAPQQGMQISLNLAIGPSIGLETPYYIRYKQFTPVPYDPAIHSVEKIKGQAFIFRGLFESNIVIGANIKTSLSFEFGVLKSNVSGLEVGFLLDAYSRQINMMSRANNKAIWPAVFITLFYGSRK